MSCEFWNPRYETMSQDELHALQSERLCRLVSRVYNAGGYFRSKLDQAGVKPGDIRSVEDLHLLPFMSKEDFRINYPLGMNTVPESELREFHMSSGSTGTPVVMAYTQNDLLQWAECMARCYRMAGL